MANKKVTLVNPSYRHNQTEQLSLFSTLGMPITARGRATDDYDIDERMAGTMYEKVVDPDELPKGEPVYYGPEEVHYGPELPPKKKSGRKAKSTGGQTASTKGKSKMAAKKSGKKKGGAKKYAAGSKAAKDRAARATATKAANKAAREASAAKGAETKKEGKKPAAKKGAAKRGRPVGMTTDKRVSVLDGRLTKVEKTVKPLQGKGALKARLQRLLGAG